MRADLEKEGCLYQDDVVDYLVKANNTTLLKENANGNIVFNGLLRHVR